MSHDELVLTFVLGLFLGMVLLLELGRGFARLQQARRQGEFSSGLGPLEGALFGLLGLLVAFTFSGAANRFETHRHLIVEEANAIGAAYLRLDVLPAAAQGPLRTSFRDYADARLGGYKRLPDVKASREEFERAALLQDDIWQKAIAATRDEGGQSARVLLLPALNAMFDVTTTRAVADKTHAPTIIFAMLALLACVCSFLAGVTTAKTTTAGFLQTVAFPLIFVVTVYVILDLEYPRSGIIRIDTVDQVISDVRQHMQ